MKKIKDFFVTGAKRMDPVLFVTSLILTFMSLITIWGARENFGFSKFVMQLAMTVLGIICMFFIVNIDYRYFVNKFYKILFIGSAALLAITLIFGVTGVNNDTANKSWLTIIKIGSRAFMIQPSEFVKVALIITFSKHLSMVQHKINHPKTLLFLAIHAGSIVGLILLSGDLGVALVYVGIIAIMLLAAGLSPWYFVGAIALLIIAFPFLWSFLAEYQKERILVGFNPELDPTDKGWQPLLSRSAIIAGGIFGRGLNSGGFYEELPASHTDFIFSTYCEKFGFFGGLLMIVTMVVLVVRILMIAQKCRRSYATFICVGIAAMFIVQSVMNLGMCLALLPVIGITLPFMSAGGSSMLALYLGVGMVHSIASYEKRYSLEGAGHIKLR